ncbi:putative ammonium transporter 1 [Hyalella azteca]|uniref:Ammonium transporter n=1 Tax=Hyalella azteca TaxID=294128 RepID=A0A979FKI9_HYAAZ|nr:putative ammonium transporter 1 [Hyalella azteca]
MAAPKLLPLFGETQAFKNISKIDDEIAVLKENLDVFFLVTISFIVFFLHAGFSFLEVGAVRSKNATNVLFKNLFDIFLGGIAFWLFGYAIAFGKGSLIGTTFWASYDVKDLQMAHWLFQFVFAATAATIVSGAVAERCAFAAYFIYSTLITGLVYPVVAHWAWSDDGWLGRHGYHDFAGSGVVHLTGGVAALAGAVFLGPRIGRFDGERGEPPEPITGHSVPLAGLGGFILLFGFLAFNGGSQGSISRPGDAAAVARAVVNTILSGCSAGLSVLVTYRLSGNNNWSFLMALNGSLVGMVSICSGCNVLRPWGACIAGLVGGVIYVMLHYLMIRIRVDDPLDAVAVHMGGGMWGLMATPLLMENGILYGNLEGFQILAWNGMDILKHGEPAYPADAWIEEQYYSTFYKKAGRPSSRHNSALPFQMNAPHSSDAVNGVTLDHDISQSCSPQHLRRSSSYGSLRDSRLDSGLPKWNALEMQRIEPCYRSKRNTSQPYANQAFVP